MKVRPPRSTLSSSSAASDVYKRQTPHSVVYSSDGHVCCALGFGEGLSLAGASDGAPPPQPTEDTVAATAQRSPHLVAEPLLQAQSMIAEATRNIPSSQGSGDASLSEFSKVPHHFSVPLAKADDEVSIAVNIGSEYETATIDFFKSNKWIANFNLQLCDANCFLKSRLQIAVYIQSGTTVHLKPFTVPPPAPRGGVPATTDMADEIER
eukprot:TRINITY_DN32435_c0_g1_i2.p1 TRINITY_DN32435_c0_g1~~TRINITY_DN32435_c0_g1_i2.p1  ORF type:complete len:209 (-),score=47.47 TRINITY_DN32435_c0_g1_i2:162-788(-)